MEGEGKKDTVMKYSERNVKSRYIYVIQTR